MNKKIFKQREQIAQKIFASKNKFHRSMAMLSFDEKLRMLSELRKFTSVVKRGRIWKQ